MARGNPLGLAILGAWLGLTLFMWFVAARSFATVDRVLQSSDPGFTEATKPLAATAKRAALRHLASEINRTCFRAYIWSQVALGALLVILLWRQMPRDSSALFIVAGMLALVFVLGFIVTPQIVTLGRSLDFVPRDPAPPGMAHFRMLHAAFTALDGVKLLAGLGLLVRAALTRPAG